MIGLETYWAFKHAWRGAGYYYRKGDHQPLTKGGTSYYANALSIVASWETWYLPRPQPIHPVLVESPDAWELDAHYPGGFEKPTFPSKTIPVSMATREANLVGYLSPEKGNMWSLIYETSHKAIQSYWKYAHHYAVQHSHTNKEYYSWDKFNDDISTNLVVEDWPPPKNFDPRFYYYSKDVNVTEELSTEEGRKTTEEAEIAKTASYTMNEFPSLEMKLISEDTELERGKKRGLEGPVQPPSQLRRQGTARVSSVPPGSSTALARERAATMNPRPPTGKGTSQGKGWGPVPTGKLPPEFTPMSSSAFFGDMSIEERKNKIFHQKIYNSAWDTLRGILTGLGASEDNLPAFEGTFIHWFRTMETTPMNIALEALLQPLYEEERKAYFEDLPPDTPEDVLALHKEIIVDSLTNVKNFMTSFGLMVKDFFDTDKSRFTLHPVKGGKGGKGGKDEVFPALGGKPTGKGSARRPKEPTPLSKQEGPVPLGKSTQESVSIPLVLHKPPVRMGDTATPPVVKASAAKQPEIESEATVESVPKAGLTLLDPLKKKGEAEVVADPTKEKGEAVQPTEQPTAKVETTAQQTPPKAEAKEKSIEPIDKPKSGGQPASLMSIAGIKGAFGFGHSKPERPPPPVSQAELTQLEKDEEADFNAAVQESLKAPTTPHVQSGAQSSSTGPMDLDQRESDLLTQLDKLSVESLRLETTTNPSIRDKSRMRTIEGVINDIVKQLEEIAQQRLRSSAPAMSSQPSIVQSALPIAAPPISKPEVSSAPKAVTPHRREPLTIETLMQGITGQQDTSAVISSVFTPTLPDEEAQQSAALLERPPDPVRVRSRERTPVRQARSSTPQKEVQQVLPAIEDGSPPRRELEPELPRERERTPHREHFHERRQEETISVSA